MPTYDYKCDSCKDVFERFQSITDKPLGKCPTCGGSVRRMIGTGAGIIFKGSGFYQTDYKSSCPAKEAKPKEGGDKPSPCGGCPCNG